MALVPVNSYRDPIEAELAIVRLEQAGISATLVDQYLTSIQWLYSNAIGGVKVMVEDADLDAAREALNEMQPPGLSTLPEAIEPIGIEARCPSCGSEKFTPRGFNGMRRRFHFWSTSLDRVAKVLGL